MNNIIHIEEKQYLFKNQLTRCGLPKKTDNLLSCIYVFQSPDNQGWSTDPTCEACILLHWTDPSKTAGWRDSTPF